MPEGSNQTPASNRGRRKIPKAETKMLEAGLSLIAVQGISGCRVEEITQAAGLAKGTFFNYFGSKEAFVLRLVDYVLSDLARRVGPLDLTPTDAESLLAGLSSVHMRYFQLRPQAAALLNQACQLSGHKAVGPALRQRLEQHVELLANKLEPACAPLNWPRERIRELALSLWAHSMGFFWIGGALDIGRELPLNLLDRLAKAQARGLAGG